jgi:hypothetical protein
MKRKIIKKYMNNYKTKKNLDFKAKKIKKINKKLLKNI